MLSQNVCCPPDTLNLFPAVEEQYYNDKKRGMHNMVEWRRDGEGEAGVQSTILNSHYSIRRWNFDVEFFIMFIHCT